MRHGQFLRIFQIGKTHFDFRANLKLKDDHLFLCRVHTVIHRRVDSEFFAAEARALL